MATSEYSGCAWCLIDGRAVFLDIAADRYFCLDDDANAAFVARIHGEGRRHWSQPPGSQRPDDFIQAETSVPQRNSTFSLPEVARALWLQRRVERRLAIQGLATVLENVRDTLARCRERRGSSIPDGAGVIAAFERARLLRSAANRCLPRSIALALGLAARGVCSQLIIGVRLAPFGAHCWVQAGSTVLNETVEEVRRYTPILVL